MKICNNCKNRGRKRRCDLYTSMSTYAEKCKDFEEKKQTNADRIRSMSDEELALFLCNIHEPDEDTIVIDDKEFFAETEILEWLQSEVEE